MAIVAHVSTPASPEKGQDGGQEQAPDDKRVRQENLARCIRSVCRQSLPDASGSGMLCGMTDVVLASESTRPVSDGTKIAAVALLLAGFGVAAVSLLVGASPFIIEPEGAADPINCGGSWDRPTGLHHACYTTFDMWSVAARVGIAVSVVLVALAVFLLVRGRATRSR